MLPNYSLGATDAEHRRLVQLASHEQDRVTDACHRNGIGPGATVLDLGCGPLGAVAALASVVGTDGLVIGVDGSSAALDKARRYASPGVRFVQADVNDVSRDQLGIEAADLAYCRLVLLHQSDPARVLRNITTLLRPGGVVIAHEPSDLPIHAPASHPPTPAMTRVWELVIAAARARGARTDFARNGRTYLEQAGFAVESSRTYAVHYPAEVGFDIPRVALQSLRPTLAEHKLATDDEIQRLDDELEEAKRRSDVQWVSSPMMFEWVGATKNAARGRRF